MTLHVPVLKDEVIKLLNIKDGDIVVDATLGGGGHAKAILEKIGKGGNLIAIDLDNSAIERFKSKIKNQKSKFEESIFLINGNFANLGEILKSLKIEKVHPHTNCTESLKLSSKTKDKHGAKKRSECGGIGVGVNAVLADLGWSSDQLSGRGMSFLKDEPLDMRLNDNQELTAKEVVNSYGREDLERILKEYGEERFAKNISKKIVEYRKNKTIETTGELLEIIKSAIPKRYQHGKINPATRTFQAIRIEVNEELENLRKFIPQALEALAPEGRLAIISFHSLEDRIVKNIFRENAGGCICPPDFPQCRCGKVPKVRIITKKPIIAGEEELENNPRSRSAKLRICERI